MKERNISRRATKRASLMKTKESATDQDWVTMSRPHPHIMRTRRMETMRLPKLTCRPWRAHELGQPLSLFPPMRTRVITLTQNLSGTTFGPGTRKRRKTVGTTTPVPTLTVVVMTTTGPTKSLTTVVIIVVSTGFCEDFLLPLCHDSALSVQPLYKLHCNIFRV